MESSLHKTEMLEKFKHSQLLPKYVSFVENADKLTIRMLINALMFGACYHQQKVKEEKKNALKQITEEQLIELGFKKKGLNFNLRIHGDLNIFLLTDEELYLVDYRDWVLLQDSGIHGPITYEKVKRLVELLKIKEK